MNGRNRQGLVDTSGVRLVGLLTRAAWEEGAAALNLLPQISADEFPRLTGICGASRVAHSCPGGLAPRAAARVAARSAEPPGREHRLSSAPPALGGRRVQRRFSHPVGASPPEANRLRPRSTGGAGARKPAGEALRQPSRKGEGATLQVATGSERSSSRVTRTSGGRAGLRRAKAARAGRNESATTVLTGGVSAATGSEGGESNWRSPWWPAQKARRSGRAYNREWEGAGRAPGWRSGW